MRELIDLVEFFVSDKDKSESEKLAQSRENTRVALERKRLRNATPAANMLARVGNVLLKREPFKSHVRLYLGAKDNTVWLVGFEAFPKGEGWGANFLKLLCREASRDGASLSLVAANDKLMSYYSRFGFESDPKSGHLRSMVRQP